MNGDWRTDRFRFPVLQAAAVVAVLAAIGAAVVLLERSRSRELIAADVKLWRTEDGTIRGAHFVTDEVTEDHWALLRDAAESLQSVNLSNTQQVAGGLQRLAAFPNLRDLYLVNCGWVDDAAVAPIAKTHRLHSLDISGTSLTDAGVRQFDLSDLTSFKADRCAGLTDETFEMLEQLLSLKSVSLREIPFDQFEQLRISRPGRVVVATPALSWDIVSRIELGSTRVHWLTAETDVDQFVRYWKSPRIGLERYLTLAGPGVARALPKILSEMTEVVSLALADTKLSGGFEHLPRSVTSLRLVKLHAESRLDGLESATWLTRLWVTDAQFTSEQWAEFFSIIAANRSLTSLILEGAEIPAGTFAKLREHAELQHLSLSRLHADSQLDGIEKITWLKSVSVRDVSFTSGQWKDFFSAMTANEALTQLSVAGAEVPPGALVELKDHRQLRHLSLSNAQVTDADLEVIGQMSSLERLSTADIPISDAIVGSWMHLPRLKSMSVYRGGVGPEIAERLRQKYPDAQVYIR
jgi:hypothetical protein